MKNDVIIVAVVAILFTAMAIDLFGALRKGQIRFSGQILDRRNDPGIFWLNAAVKGIALFLVGYCLWLVWSH